MLHRTGEEENCISLERVPTTSQKMLVQHQMSNSAHKLKLFLNQWYQRTALCKLPLFKVLGTE